MKHAPRGKVLWPERWSYPLPGAGPGDSVGKALNSHSLLPGATEGGLGKGRGAARSSWTAGRVTKRHVSPKNPRWQSQKPRQPCRAVEPVRDAAPPPPPVILSVTACDVKGPSGGHNGQPASPGEGCLSSTLGGSAEGLWGSCR